MIIDPDAPLSGPVTTQGFQAVSGRHPQLLERMDGIEQQQFPAGRAFNGTEPGNHLVTKQRFRIPPSKGPNQIPVYDETRNSASVQLDMCNTCKYAGDMSKMIQIRNVPEDVHSVLKARAAREGMSLSDFLKRELEQVAARPVMREWLERARETRPIVPRQRAADVIRKMRESR